MCTTYSIQRVEIILIYPTDLAKLRIHVISKDYCHCYEISVISMCVYDSVIIHWESFFADEEISHS